MIKRLCHNNTITNVLYNMEITFKSAIKDLLICLQHTAEEELYNTEMTLYKNIS